MYVHHAQNKMSDASSVSSETTHSSVAQRENANKLCSRVYSILGAPLEQPFTIAMLRKSSVVMTSLRDCLVAGEALSREGKTFLMCAGMCCYRRYYTGEEEQTVGDLVCKTMSLLFVLLTLAEGPMEEGQGVDLDAEDHDMFSSSIAEAFPKDGQGVPRSAERRLLDAWWQSSVSDFAFGLSGTHASSIGHQLRDDAAISRAALTEARRLGTSATMDEFFDLATVFFRTSAAAAVNSLIQQREPDFVSLETAGVVTNSLENRDELLGAIVSAAESEAGQAVLRDMILSFRLPQKALGVRRTLLFTRELNALATRQHTEALNAAHEAAMRGAEWSWTKDDDQVHKAAALLAGYAVITAKSQDVIRRGNAFRGRVCLPFLECMPPKNKSATRLVMLSGGEWAIFKTSSSGQPRVLLKQSGFEGLCMCLLYMSSSQK